MLELAGDSQISLEGNLARCQFNEDVLLARDETAFLRRNTIAPRQDFMVLRLSPETVEDIFRQAMAVGLKHAIIHVQIARSGVLELGGYDHFHPDCVITGPGVSRALLDDLTNAKVLNDFSALASRE
jgi:hypothetical protein